MIWIILAIVAVLVFMKIAGGGGSFQTGPLKVT